MRLAYSRQIEQTQGPAEVMDGDHERVVKTDCCDVCFGSDVEMGEDLSKKVKVALIHLSAVE